MTLLVLISSNTQALEVKGGMNLHVFRNSAEPGYYARIGDFTGMRSDIYKAKSDLYYYENSDKIYLDKSVKSLLISFRLLDLNKFYASLAGGPYFIKYEDPQTGVTDKVNPFGFKGECGYKINLKDNLKLTFNVGLDLVGQVSQKDLNIADEDLIGNDYSGGFYYGTGISILF